MRSLLKFLMSAMPPLCLFGCAALQQATGTSEFPRPDYHAEADFQAAYDSGSIEEKYDSWNGASRSLVFTGDAKDRLKTGYRDDNNWGRGSITTKDAGQTLQRTGILFDKDSSRQYTATAISTSRICGNMLNDVINSRSLGTERFICPDQDLSWKIELSEKGADSSAGSFIYALLRSDSVLSLKGEWKGDSVLMEWEGRSGNGSKIPYRLFPEIQPPLFDGAFEGFEILRFCHEDATQAVIIPRFLPWQRNVRSLSYTAYFRKDLDNASREKIMMTLSLYNLAIREPVTERDNAVHKRFLFGAKYR